jgi:predicted Holliday junction resolvase-like endonuclease
LKLLEQIRKAAKLYATCPTCDEEFPISKAVLFSIRDPLPPEANDKIQDMRALLTERRHDLKRMRERATTVAARTAQSVNLGKILEKIVPSFRAFAFSPRDCRALFEPIDYIVFKGLTQNNKVEALYFVDIKSGRATLTARERMIRRTIERGHVQFARMAESQED